MLLRPQAATRFALLRNCLWCLFTRDLGTEASHGWDRESGGELELLAITRAWEGSMGGHGWPPSLDSAEL